MYMNYASDEKLLFEKNFCLEKYLEVESSAAAANADS